MKRLFIILLSLIIFSLDMARCQTKNYKEKLESLYNHSIPMIETDQLSDDLKNGKEIILLDIRSQEEYAVSSIKGAKLIDYDSFSEEMVGRIPKNAEIVVYCSVGYRSEKVGEKLKKLGYKHVKNLYGGIFQWKNDGFEVVNSQNLPTDSVHTYNKSWSQWLINGVRVY